MSSKYPAILNEIFKSHDEMMPFGVPDGEVVITLLFRGDVYRVGFNENELLRPYVMRYTGFGMAEPLMEKDDAHPIFAEQLKDGLYAYLTAVLKKRQGEYLPEALQKFAFSRFNEFAALTTRSDKE